MDGSTLICNDSVKTGEVILIESDEEYFFDNQNYSCNKEHKNKLESNSTLTPIVPSNIIISNGDQIHETDVFKNNEVDLINDEILMPKIIAVTGGVHFIPTDDNESLLISNDIINEQDNITEYEEMIPKKRKRSKVKKKVRFLKNAHVKNRIKRIIRKQIKKNPKQYLLMKPYVKLLQKTKKIHYTLMKTNIRKFHSALPVKVKTNENHLSSLVWSRRSQKGCDDYVRTEIIEQLKIFREKCIKQNDIASETETSVLETYDKKVLKKSSTNLDKTPSTEECQRNIFNEHNDPCCSKSIYEKPSSRLACSESLISTKESSLNCSVKSFDKSKYKSLKYKMYNRKSQSDNEISNEVYKKSNNQLETNSQNSDCQFSEENKSALNIDLQSSKLSYTEIDDKGESIIHSELTDNRLLDIREKKSQNTLENKQDYTSEDKLPRLDAVIEKIRALRPKKITEKDDIIAVLKCGNNTSGEISVSDDEKSLEINSHSSYGSMRVKKEKQPNISPPGQVKIAISNGKIIKPKTLAEKRRLLRREFESEMRNKMQVNDQLLERQILRQKSNNRRIESADVRERLLYDNAPMTRNSWIRATELQSSNTAFSQQFMMIEGRYVRICGSRGGSKRFLSPPPTTDSKCIGKVKPTINSKQKSQFLPGPLSKKHLLIRNPLKVNGVYTRKKLPPIFLEVLPKSGRSLEATAQSYLKSAFSNIVDEKRARFAASAISSSKDAIKYSFPLEYKNGQKEILCRLKEECKVLPEQKIKKETLKQLETSDDKSIITDMLSDMFSCVETSFLDSSIIKDDPDALVNTKSTEASEKLVSIPAAVSQTRVRTALELRRLNVTVIEAKECSSSTSACCREDYCRLGCVCSSLKCLVLGIRRHCGNVDCMFECKCEYTHRLRQKRTLCHNSSDIIDEDDLLELKDRVCSGLAPVEAEFKHAAVVNQDRSVTLVDVDTEKRKRNVKIPKRFDDYVSSELPIFISPTIIPVKTIEDIPEVRRIKTPIIPKEKLLFPRNLEVRLYNLGLDHVEPWCMVHELYRCYCDCMDAYGEPFAEGKLENSNDQGDQCISTKQSGCSIKTLNRTILLDTDDNNSVQKRNWHVESFTNDNDEYTSSIIESIKRKAGPISTKMNYFSSMRRKSNDLKRARVSEEDKIPAIVPKHPRLQIKSPSDLNSMINKKEGTGSLLQEFALSTSSVIEENISDDYQMDRDNTMNKVETSIRIQRDNMRRSMRCARINQPYLLKNRDRNKKDVQKRLASLSVENENPELLKRLQLLVKRSQISSQQRGLRLDNIDDNAIKPNRNLRNSIEIIPIEKSSKTYPLCVNQVSDTDTNLQKSETESKSMCVSTTSPQKDQKAMSSIINREILRMLNQKGALDAYFDISKPWDYKFQCLQWYKMLCRYKMNKIKLWLEKKPEQSTTMALLTTSSNPPLPNCVNMSTLEYNISKRNYKNIPKFAIKIFSDCQKLHDPKHKFQYVFMRACSTYWTLEGVIEKGYKSQSNGNDNEISITKTNKEITKNADDALDRSNIVQKHDKSENKVTINNDVRKSGIEIFRKTDNTLDKQNNSLQQFKVQNSLLNNELLKTRTEIEATLVNVKSPNSETMTKINNNNKLIGNEKTNLTILKGPINESKLKESLTKKKRLSHMNTYNTSSELIDSSVNGSNVTKINDVITIKRNQTINSLAQKRLKNYKSGEYSDHLNMQDKLEALPFLVGMRYLFVSMNEHFNLLTSMRNGYKVSYQQLRNAILTANLRNVYVRLKFKQNDLNSYERGIVFAVPWCLDGVFIGPYGLSEQCLITKQIFHNDKTMGLSEYTRTVQKREPKPVGYWMCYYGDDTKFVRACESLVRRLNDLEMRPRINDEQHSNNPSNVPVIKGTSPNSVLKTSLGQIQSSPNQTQVYSKMPQLKPMLNNMKVVAGSKIEQPPLENQNKISIDEVPKLIKYSKILPKPIETLSEKSNPKTSTDAKQSLKKAEDIKETSKLIPDKLLRNTLQKQVFQTTPCFKKTDSVFNNNNSSKISSLSKRSETSSPPQNFVNKATVTRSLLRKENIENNTVKNNLNEVCKKVNNEKSKALSTSVDKINDSSDDEPELIINEAETEVIDLLSDSEDETTNTLGSPGKRWLYCDVNGVGYLEAQVLRNNKIQLRLPLSPTEAEFSSLPDAATWINSNLRKIVYFLPNTFVPTWTMTTSFNVVQSMKKMSKVLFQGNFVIYNHLLIDLTEQKNIDDHITNKIDHELAIKYAEHFASRFMKHALGLKFSSQIDKEKLAKAAHIEIKSIVALEANLTSQKKSLISIKKELEQKLDLKRLEDNSKKKYLAKSTMMKPVISKNMKLTSKDSIVIDE